MFLWTGVGWAPIEFIVYRLCKMFGKLPSELKDEDPQWLTAMLVCSEVEDRVANPVQMLRR